MKLLKALLIFGVSLLGVVESQALTVTYKAKCFFYREDCIRFRSFYDTRDSYRIGTIASACHKSTIDPSLSVPEVGCPKGEWGFVPYVQFPNVKTQLRINKFRGFCSLWPDQAKRYSDFLNTISSLTGKSRFSSSYRKITSEEHESFRNSECRDARYMVEGAVILDQ